MPTSDVTLDPDTRLDDELAGLDALELLSGGRRPCGRRLWAAAWPKLAAAATKVMMVGRVLVKPSDCFMKKAQTISNSPATRR